MPSESWLANRSSHPGSEPTFAVRDSAQLRWATFAWDAERRLEAPPGFEPGVEVLQTSALPLGDGAPKWLAGLKGPRYLLADFSHRFFSRREQRAERSGRRVPRRGARVSGG